jgi:hypothetical protein
LDVLQFRMHRVQSNGNPQWPGKYSSRATIIGKHETSAHILNFEFYNEQQTETHTNKMTSSNISTAVKVVISMVVVAALVATRFSSSKVRQ